MDQRDEFSKWLSKVEEALTGEMDINMLPQSAGACGCQDWKCQTCFPDTEVVASTDVGQNTCPTCGAGCEQHQDTVDTDNANSSPNIQAGKFIPQFDLDAGLGIDLPMEEEDQEFTQEPTPRGRDGKGVKLGDIVQKYVPVGSNDAGEDSPLTYGEDNLSEDDYSFDDDDQPDYDADPLAQRELDQFKADSSEFAMSSDQDISRMAEMAGQIKYIQDRGLSKSPRMYSEDDFSRMSLSQIKACYQEVTGNNAVAQGEPTMEGIDKDVQTLLKKFKDYDQLVMEDKKDLPAFLKKGKADDKKANDERNEKVGAEVFKSNRKEEKKDDVKESANQPDAEVIEWMNRFSKLGNMKGYGR